MTLIQFERLYCSWSLRVGIWHFRLRILKYIGGGRSCRVTFERYGLIAYLSRGTGYCIQFGFDAMGHKLAGLRRWARKNPEAAEALRAELDALEKKS